MSHLLLVALLIALAVIVMLALRRRLADSGSTNRRYYLRKSVLSPAERSFLGVLDPNLPAEMRALAKVRLEDVFGVVSGLDPAGRASARNRIKSRHVDFLIVRANDLAPIAGIELDDSSHATESRQQRDEFVNEVFKSTGLPLLHLPVQKAYSPSEIRGKITALLS